MKYLFLMGGSGSGKTTLAMNLEKEAPELYHRVLEISTRPIRQGEVDGFDYDFKTDEEYDVISDSLFEKVEYQFSPYRYGAEYSQLSNDKWNVVVVSLEGLFSAMKKLKPTDTAILFNILLDVDCDVARKGRDPLAEQRMNLAVIHNLLSGSQILLNGRQCFYSEILLSKLKKIRGNKHLYLPYIAETIKSIVNTSLAEQLKSTENYDQLVYIFMNNSSSISNSTNLLDILELQCKKFKKSVKELCDDSLRIVKNYGQVF